MRQGGDKEGVQQRDFLRIGKAPAFPQETGEPSARFLEPKNQLPASCAIAPGGIRY
jgi:hypothetical protein